MKGNTYYQPGLGLTSDIARVLVTAATAGQLLLVGCASDNDPVRPAAATAGSAGVRSSAGAAGLAGTVSASGGMGNAAGDASTPGGSTNEPSTNGGGGAAGAPTNKAGAAGDAVAKGGAGGNTLATTGGTGGSAPGTCQAFTSPGGTKLTPPSNGFEANTSGWTNMRGDATAVSRQQASGVNCEGSSYLLLDTTGRSAAWDGPAIDVTSYLTAGHQYQVSLAARFDPKGAPTDANKLTMSVVLACKETGIQTSYAQVQQASTVTDWVRLSGTLPTSLTNCSQLAKIQVYVQTDTNVSLYPIDIDDFQLWDVTSVLGGVGGAGGGGGAGGVGTAGSPGGAGRSNGTAGSLGSGGSGGSGGTTQSGGGVSNGGVAGAVGAVAGVAGGT